MHASSDGLAAGAGGLIPHAAPDATAQALPRWLSLVCASAKPAVDLAMRRPNRAMRLAVDVAFTLFGAGHGYGTDATNVTIPAADGTLLPARLYTPRPVPASAGLLVFFHGGGFVLGSLRSHATACRYVARQANCRVLATSYRQPPAHPFPAAYEDCLAAFRWAAMHAEQLGADPGRVAIGGDSAGGGLAAAVALATADDDRPPCFAWLCYPFVEADMNVDESARRYAHGPLLGRSSILDMLDHYAPPSVDRSDWRLSVARSDALGRMMPTYIATAGMDPLRDQAERFARQLKDAGATVELRRFDGLPHGFGVMLVARRAREAVIESCAPIARALRPGIAGDFSGA